MFLALAVLSTCIGATYYYRKEILNKILQAVPLATVVSIIEDSSKIGAIVSSSPGLNFRKITNNCAEIKYFYGNKEYKLFVPFSRRDSCTSIHTKVIAKPEDVEKDTIDLTQQPGMPYLINGEHFPGYKIYVEKDNTVHILEDGECISV